MFREPRLSRISGPNKATNSTNVTNMANLTIFCQIRNSGEWAPDKGPNKAANLTNSANVTNMANLMIFRQISKFRRMNSRQGSQQSDEYGKSDDISANSKFRGMSSRQGSQQSSEFGESGDISPNPKIQANELERRVPTKWMQAKGSSPTPSLRKH